MREDTVCMKWPEEANVQRREIMVAWGLGVVVGGRKWGVTANG